MNPEADVIAAIGELERDAVDDLVDWQMTDSPAAHADREWSWEWGPAVGACARRLPPDPLTEVDLAAWGVPHATLMRAIAHIDERVRGYIDEQRAAAAGFARVPRGTRWALMTDEQRSRSLAALQPAAGSVA